MNFKLDLSKFKKIQSDDKSTTMRHEDGHTMTIAHKALPAKMRKQLLDLPSNEDATKAQVKEKGSELKGNPKLQQAYQSMDNGGEVKTLGESIGYPGFGKKQAVPDTSGTKPKQPPKAMADGGEVADDSDSDKVAQQLSAPIANPLEKASQDLMALGQPGIQEAPAPSQAQALSAPQEGMNQESNPNQDSANALAATSGATQNALEQGAAEKIQGLGQEAEHQGQLAQQQAQILNKQVANQQAALDTLKHASDQTNDLINSTIDDVKAGHINPHQLVDNQSTAQRLGTIASILVGGFNFGTGPNPGMEALQKNIDRDIDAQKANLNNKQNLLGFLSKHMGDLNDAATVAKNIQAGITSDMMAAQANKMQPGILRDQALQKAAEVKMMYAPQLEQLKLKRAAAAAGATGDPEKMISFLRITNPEMAKEMESRYVPGVGLSSIPVPEPMRDRLVKQSTLINATQHLRDWVKEHGASANPKVRAEGETLAAELQQMYRQGVGASTSEGEQKTINDNIIASSPAQILARWNVDPKLKALQSSMIASHDVTRKLNGLPPLAAGRTERAMQTAEPEIRTLNGAKYQKVPGGWAKIK